MLQVEYYKSTESGFKNARLKTEKLEEQSEKLNWSGLNRLEYLKKKILKFL